jgi:imidazolonepropionase-like amidohydrolase
VAERAARGCDFVKIMATGGVITPGFLPHQSQYDEKQLRAVVEAARDAGIPTAAHAHGSDGIRDSVAAGVHSVEHCTFFDETGVRPDWDVIRTMVDKGIFVTTTGAVLPGMEPPPMIAARIEQFRINVQRMRSMGARIVCTSDAGVGPSKPHGVLPHGVVEAVRIGFSNAEALATVTSEAAAVCGMTGRKGALAPGHDADVLAVHGNPLADIADVQRVAAVYRAGVRVR